MAGFILAIDQGTTSSRAIVFHGDCPWPASRSRNSRSIFPRSGWVEHDAEDIWRTTLATVRDALAKAGLRPRDIAAHRHHQPARDHASCGTARPASRSTTPSSGRTAAPPTPAQQLKTAGHEKTVTRKTGLLLDPYFSATKIAWMLDHVAGARAAAERGELAFGTVDSFLLWRLTGGTVHATDATNASRTLLFDIHKRRLGRRAAARCSACRARMLPEVRDCAAEFGDTDGRAPWRRRSRSRGIAGDQQAATIGQACFEPGMIKATYGTGCFALLNTGTQAGRARSNRLLTTIAYQLDGQRTYALEGSIFIAGAAVQWLRDGLKLIAMPRRRRKRWRRRPSPNAAASIWCRPSSVSARRIGTPMRAARSSG